VKMIAHQAIGMHLPARLLASLGEGLQEPLSILVVGKNRVPAIATIHNVIDRAGVLDAQLASHGCSIADRSLPCQ